MKPPYFLLEDGKPTGPYSLIVLHQKAEIRVINPDSFVRPVSPADAPWSPIGSLPELNAILFPPRAPATLARIRPASGTNPPIALDGRPVEVEHLLRDNTARLVATEQFNPSAIPNGRRQRHRAYLLALLVLVTPAWAAHRFELLPRTDLTLVILLSFVALAGLLSYWIIYHLTDFRS